MRAGLDHAVLNCNVIRYWTDSVLNRPVKLTSLQRPPMFWTEGYVTSYKFVAGRTLSETERILGLKAGELGRGAYFYELARLPTAEEFVSRGYIRRRPTAIPGTRAANTRSGLAPRNGKSTAIHTSPAGS